MVDIVVLQDRAETALKLGESHFREFKSAFHGPPNKKISREIKTIAKNIGEVLVGFANADGGELVVGVEDDGSVTGIEHLGNDEIHTLREAPSTYVHDETPIKLLRISKLTISNHDVLYFSVSKGHEYIHLTSDGRCLQRKDLETVPITVERIQFDRQEIKSREYDREFIDGPQASDLNRTIVSSVADHLSKGMSIERCLQHLSLAEYIEGGLRLRRAAMLLFASRPELWHPRLQIRIVKVNGTDLKSGEEYNVATDETVSGNIFELIEKGWDALRPHLVETRMGSDARFESTVMYPELACREALVNAIAHRDYSQEGRSIEIFVFDDRMEVTNPGALLSTITVDDLLKLEGVHQSRNSYISRVLREVGYMRELGEGVRRIFELMKSNELANPEINSKENSFSISLYHRPIYNKEELLWLDQFSAHDLSREQKSVIVLGMNERLIAPQDIWDKLGIVDTEEYRKIVSSLQVLNILFSEINKSRATQISRQKKVPVRRVPRFKIRVPTGSNDKSQQSKTLRSTRIGERDDIMAPVPQAKLFIGNVSYQATVEDLATYFSTQGDVQNIQLPKSGAENKGYAFVEYENRQIAEEAMRNLDQTMFRGRKIYITWHNPSIKSK